MHTFETERFRFHYIPDFSGEITIHNIKYGEVFVIDGEQLFEFVTECSPRGPTQRDLDRASVIHNQQLAVGFVDKGHTGDCASTMAWISLSKCFCGLST